MYPFSNALRGRNGVEIVGCGAAEEAIKGDRRLFLRDKHQGSDALQGISVRRTSTDDIYVGGIGVVDGGRVIKPIERQGACGISTGLRGTSLGVKMSPGSRSERYGINLSRTRLGDVQCTG
jgi:hypothetical protein